jgi:hypothetical protein
MVASGGRNVRQSIADLGDLASGLADAVRYVAVEPDIEKCSWMLLSSLRHLREAGLKDRLAQSNIR